MLASFGMRTVHNSATMTCVTVRETDHQHVLPTRHHHSSTGPSSGYADTLQLSIMNV